MSGPSITTSTIIGEYSGSGGGGGSGVSSLASNGSLVFDPTTGAVIGTINTGHTNDWSVQQNFQGGIDLQGSSLLDDGTVVYSGDAFFIDNIFSNGLDGLLIDAANIQINSAITTDNSLTLGGGLNMGTNDITLGNGVNANIESDGDGGLYFIDEGNRILQWNAWDQNGLQLNGANLVMNNASGSGGNDIYMDGGNIVYLNTITFLSGGLIYDDDTGGVIISGSTSNNIQVESNGTLNMNGGSIVNCEAIDVNGIQSNGGDIYVYANLQLDSGMDLNGSGISGAFYLQFNTGAIINDDDDGGIFFETVDYGTMMSLDDGAGSIDITASLNMNGYIINMDSESYLTADDSGNISIISDTLLFADTVAYTNGWFGGGDSGLFYLGDFYSNLNSTVLEVDDTLETIAVNATNGFVVQSGSTKGISTNAGTNYWKFGAHNTGTVVATNHITVMIDGNTYSIPCT